MLGLHSFFWGVKLSNVPPLKSSGSKSSGSRFSGSQSRWLMVLWVMVLWLKMAGPLKCAPSNSPGFESNVPPLNNEFDQFKCFIIVHGSHQRDYFFLIASDLTIVDCSMQIQVLTPLQILHPCKYFHRFKYFHRCKYLDTGASTFTGASIYTLQVVTPCKYLRPCMYIVQYPDSKYLQLLRHHCKDFHSCKYLHLTSTYTLQIHTPCTYLRFCKYLSSCKCFCNCN